MSSYLIMIFFNHVLKHSLYKWSDNSPLAMQHFSPEKSWRRSWEFYYDYLIWLGSLKYETGYFTYWFQGQYKKISYTYISEKLKLIDNLLTNHNLTKACSLMFVWNYGNAIWLNIPCNVKILDKFDTFCIRNFNVNHKKERLLTIGKDSYNTHILLQCIDGTFVHAFNIQDDISDCLDIADEEKISVIYSLSNKKLFPNETLRELFQKTIGFNIQHVSKKINLLVDWKDFCSQTTNITTNIKKFTCIYQIHERMGNRSLCHFKHGAHLENCEEVLCPHSTYKCPSSYCIKLRYLCDGYWDCPQGYDEKDCKKSPSPGYYRCKNSTIFIVLENVCDKVPDCPLMDEELLCELDPIKCPATCKCVLFTATCSGMIGIEMVDIF